MCKVHQRGLGEINQDLKDLLQIKFETNARKQQQGEMRKLNSEKEKGRFGEGNQETDDTYVNLDTDKSWLSFEEELQETVKKIKI